MRSHVHGIDLFTPHHTAPLLCVFFFILIHFPPLTMRLGEIEHALLITLVFGVTRKRILRRGGSVRRPAPHGSVRGRLCRVSFCGGAQGTLVPGL